MRPMTGKTTSVFLIANPFLMGMLKSKDFFLKFLREGKGTSER